MAANVQILITYRQSGSTKETEDGLEGIKRKAGDAGQGLSSFGQMATGALRRVGELAVNALAAAGAALVSWAGDMVKGAGDYEQSMNVLAATTGATDAQMQQIKETAKALGGDLTLPATSAADAGNAMLELAKAGLSVDEAMAAAKGTLQLAAAAQTDEANAAQITANALNAFHLAGSDAVMVADLLAASANASSASMTDLAQGFQQGGFAFAAAGQHIDDLAASLAILTNVGLTGSDAGTALKNAMTRLMDPTDKAAKLMHDLGINVYDAQGNMLPLRDIIGVLNTQMSGMTQQQRNAALSTIFLSDGMKAMLPLLDAGVAGFDKMKAQVNQAGAAQQLAAAQMQGLNGAAAGLSSQLETLALEGLEPLLPIATGVITSMASLAGSFVGSVGPAVRGLISGVSTAAGVIQDAFVPAVAAAGAAVLAYGVTQIPAAVAALPALITMVMGATTAFLANAAAVAAAAAPFLLIAAAVGGVVYAYQNWTQANREATDQLLASKPFWQESAAALENYGQKGGETATKLKPLADNIAYMRDLIHGEIESLAKRREAGLINDAQMAQELATINQHAAGLQVATQAYNTQEQAIIRASAATSTGTARMQEMEAGEQQLIVQTQLTEEEFAKLEKKLDETFQKGAQAVSDYVTTEIGFLGDLEKSHQTHDAETLKQQALAYAQQQAAQKAHLGQMLADYTATQLAMGNITSEAAGRIMTAIEQQFGSIQDDSARTFTAMTADIDHFAASGSSDVDALSSALGNTADTAVETRQEMEALAKKYSAELVQNFLDGKIDADQLRAALQQIPKRVNIEVHTQFTYGGERPPDYGGGSTIGSRAGGGPVSGGSPYLVGEQGPELFMPASNGAIVPTDQISVGGTNVTNVYLNYAGMAQSEGDVSTALRTWQMLYG